MTNQLARIGRPVGAALLATVAVSTAVWVGSPVSTLIRGSTTVAVLAVAVLLLWQPGTPRDRTLATVPLACAVSLYATFRYEGPADNTSGLWILVESVALLVTVMPAVRGPAPAVAAVLGLFLLATVTLLPLRIALTLDPPAGPRETIGLCVVWGLAAVAAVGASCYLRSLDSRRKLAVAQERRAQRLHVARDLHDFAAHDVTGVMVLAQAAQLLAKESPEKALALLPQIESAGIQALKSMDRTIRILSELEENRRPGRDGPTAPADDPEERAAARPHSLDELPALMDRFERTGMIPARLELSPGALDGLPEQVGAVGYRVVMEALTNVRRHAPASPRVTVTAERVADGTALRLLVDNEPVPAGARAPAPAVEREGGGTGIRELRRRVAGLGGELTAGAGANGGWRMAVVLPLDGAPASRDGGTGSGVGGGSGESDPGGGSRSGAAHAPEPTA
ncbi:sensor histidine kinase [Kitasatospora sp. NPDC018619]|uniref:sensor histidine kinase n=1 Tax=unclassified Kitasatospora TaxID=2633591 RepID=UPI0037ACCFD8